MLESCPVCGAGHRSDVLSLPRMPVLINAQVRPEDAQSVTRGDIDLVVCHGCGHLYNRSFDESLLDYDAAYENTLHYSPAFQEFAGELADRLVAEHDLTGRTVAELGSGPGHFLSMLCERGVARAHGFDPSYDPERLGAPHHEAVTISAERFPLNGALPVDLALSQHVLEHLHDPSAALAMLRDAVAPVGGTVYTEVPNGSLMLDQCALWDLIYEHLSYFVPTSFALVHAQAGLDVVATGSAFGDQFMWATSRIAASVSTPSVVDTRAAVDRAVQFGVRARDGIAIAGERLRSWSDRGPVVLWGAGSKGMTYLNLVDTDHRVAGVVDINPRKARWGVPGTPHRIDAPERVVDVRPLTVIVANPMYADEVRDRLRHLDVDAEIMSMW